MDIDLEAWDGQPMEEDHPLWARYIEAFNEVFEVEGYGAYDWYDYEAWLAGVVPPWKDVVMSEG